MPKIPVNSAIEVASSVTINSGTSQTVATVSLPSGISGVTAVATLGESPSGNVQVAINGGLDGINYPFSSDVSPGFGSGSGTISATHGMITAPGESLTYAVSNVTELQFVVTNSDSINHTVTIWTVLV